LNREKLIQLNELIKLDIGTHAPGVCVVTLADGARRNAITPAMNAELIETFAYLESSDDVRSVVITGEGSAFCAGADLQHLGHNPTESGLRTMYEGFLRVASSSLPTVAAVNGPAVGAGMNLALSCDLRLAGHSARFDTRFLQLGLHPGGGHTYMMQHVMGPQATYATVLFGEKMDGTEAQAHGFVWKCVPDASLMATAVAIATRAAAAPPELARRVKQTIGTVAAIPTQSQAVDYELVAQLWSITQPAFSQRLTTLRQDISHVS
jgi:enoyl-CoA hydratase